MTEAEIRALLASFEGDVLQTPPVFSAMRVSGRRAHKLARKGHAVVLEPRSVRIDRVALVAVEEPDWVIDITCGPGVYVRSLARDLGEARGCGAYLSALRRTRSGPLRVEDGVSPAEADLADLLPLSRVLAGEPRLDLTAEEARKLALGDLIRRPGLETPPRFGWFGGRPCFRLVAPATSLVRSDLLIEDPRSLES
jgi:tRNA pseudouridine55 synthase